MMNTKSIDKKLRKYYAKMINPIDISKEDKMAQKLDFMTARHIYNYKQKKEFYRYITKQPYYASIRKELCKYLQHGDTTIMRHCRNVAYFSFTFAKFLERRFHIQFNYENLIIGAYLHDLFMYDWHEKSSNHRLHGFSHPITASKNAQKLCHINSKEQAIIESHMWPLTITKVPKSREAFLVCLFDKYSAILETFKIKF